LRERRGGFGRETDDGGRRGRKRYAGSEAAENFIQVFREQIISNVHG